MQQPEKPKRPPYPAQRADAARTGATSPSLIDVPQRTFFGQSASSPAPTVKRSLLGGSS